MDENKELPYEDIVHLSHPTSKKHVRMRQSDRAAQFAPFAALTGYDDALTETARVTDMKMILDDDRIDILNRKLCFLLERMREHPFVEILYFVQDAKKSGGEYICVKGRIRKFDEALHLIQMEDGQRIPVSDIVEITGNCLKEAFIEI